MAASAVAGNTFGGLDVIDGGAGTDTLNLTNVGGTLTVSTSAKVSNVENLSLRSAQNAVTADVQSWTGLKAVAVEQLGTKAAITVDTKSNATSVSVTGGTTVGITDNGTAATTADTLTTVSLNGNTGTATLSSDALNKVTVADSAANVIVNAAAGTRALDLTVNKLTGGTLSDVTATAVTLTATGSNSTGITLATDAATSLTVAGDKNVSLTLSDAAVNTAVISTISAAGATGGVTIVGALGNAVTFTGGAGKDSILLGASTKAANMGAGDDTVTLSGSALGVGGSVNGGDGTDTLGMTSANAATASLTTTLATAVTGFEKLSLGIVGATANDTINLANLNNINYVVSAGATGGGATQSVATAEVTTFTVAAAAAAAETITFDGTAIALISGDTAAQVAGKLAAGVYSNFTVAQVGTTAQITVTNKTTGNATDVLAANFVATGAATINFNSKVDGLAAGATVAGNGLNLTNLASNGTLELTAQGFTTVSVKDAAAGTADVLNVVVANAGVTSLNGGTVAAANVETININTMDSGLLVNPAATIDALTLVATSATKIVVAGNNGLNLTNAGNVKVTSFDASGVVGNGTDDTAANLAVTFVSANTTAAASVSIIGGAGNDTLTGSVANDIIVGGAGDDTLNGMAGVNTLTGGAGKDTFVMGGSGGVVATSGVSFSTITDLAAGDIVRLSTINNTDAVATVAGVQLGAAVAGVNTAVAVFQDYLDAAANKAAGVVSWFQLGGDTYLVQDNTVGAATFQNGLDNVIKLAGMIDLTNSTFAGTDLTIV